MNTVYISIGNSDDKLTQEEWASFYCAVNGAIQEIDGTLHGQWVSLPTSAWQNACWCIEIHDDDAGFLRAELVDLAAEYRQDAIQWNVVAQAEMLTP